VASRRTFQAWKSDPMPDLARRVILFGGETIRLTPYSAEDRGTFLGAGGGIRTHEGLRHRVLSPRRARYHRAHCPFDLAMVPPHYGAPGGSFRGRAAFEPAINGSRAS